LLGHRVVFYVVAHAVVYVSLLLLLLEPLFFGAGAIVVATPFVLALAPLGFAVSCCAVVGIGGAVGAGAGTIIVVTLLLFLSVVGTCGCCFG